MEKQTHFNLKDITSITFYPVKKLDYKWYEYSPKVTKFFGLKTIHREQAPGWCNRGGRESYSDYYGYWMGGRESTEHLEEYGKFFLGDMDKKEGDWFEQASVYINKRGQDSLQRKFKSNEEAMQWVEELKDNVKRIHNEEFEIIIH
jgi:hypothetical protein